MDASLCDTQRQHGPLRRQATVWAELMKLFECADLIAPWDTEAFATEWASWSGGE
jgi:hypothetical protein